MRLSIFKCFPAVLLVAGIGSFQVQAVELETGAAELRPLSRELRLDGVVEAVSRSTVSAQTSGQVQEILYDVDDYVEKDAVLKRFLTGMRTRFETARDDPRFAAAVVDADPETGLARSIERMLLTADDLKQL